MKRIFLILSLLIYSASILSQTSNPENLKVGLVLSGGGAKGLAHIGVLKALEEAGIQIDYIGGTSMGSIVGGLYAIGYSAEDLENIVKNNNFWDNLSDDVPRNIKSFYLKEIDDKYNVKLAVEKNKIILPSGFTNGQNLMNSITKYTQHVGNIEDFNKLPIPFLCIATDLETGKEVILKKGDLIQAIRASAAYPTLVKPIEIDDKWLVDGGIVNNFPVDEVKDMGANFIIGVEVGSHELYKKDNLRSVVNIVEQLVSYQMVNEENSAKADKVNIYFRPIDEEKYSTFSFDKADEIIQLGYETAKQQIDTLIALGKIHPLKEKKEKVIVQDVFKVRNIYFTGKKDYTYAYLMEKLQLRKGKIITFEELTNGVNRLWATDNFTNIQQKVVIDGDEGDIYIDLTLNPIKSYFQIGLTYDDLFKARVLLNWTDKSILFGTDYLSADLVVGENLRYNVNYFIDNGFHLSVGLQSTLQNFDFDSDFVTDFSSLPPEMNDRSLKFINLINRLNFQYLYRDNFAWGFGVEHLYYKVKDITTQELEQNYENSHFADLYTYFKFDSYDNRMFPRKGFYMNLCGKWFVSSSSNLTSFEPFLRGKAHLGYVIPLSKKFVIHPETEAGLSFTEYNPNPFLDFNLGGNNDNFTNFFTPFYGYPFAAMGNSSYLKTTLTLRYEVSKNHFLGIAGNIARTDDNFLKDFEFFQNTKKGFGIFYGIKTILAPVQITYSRSPELKKNFFSLKIGYWF